MMAIVSIIISFLGLMAEYMIIMKLDKTYEQKILEANIVLENILYELPMYVN